MLIVKKFGGSSVANKERIFNVARRCVEDYKKGHDKEALTIKEINTMSELQRLQLSVPE